MCLFGYEDVELDEAPSKEEKKEEPKKGDHILVSSGLHVQPIVSQVHNIALLAPFSRPRFIS